jgi:Secretion system C-terminal sorting domain
MKTLLFSVMLLTVVISPAFSTIHTVPGDYATIQHAIEASIDGDTILVAPGTYVENVIFRGKRIVVTSWFALNSDPQYIQSTVIDGSNPASVDSGSCVRIVNGEDSTAVLQGFTLTGGHGTLWEDEHGPGNYYWEGGGLFIALSSPTIRYNIIRDNNVNRTGGVSTGGGGIRLGDGAPRILNNIITNNAGMYGGGLVSNFASPIIRNNIVANNIVSQAIAGLNTFGGGGLWFNGGTQGNRIENNTIVGNSATGSGGFGSGGRGGGVLAAFSATINTRNNIVWANIQTTGGQVGTASGTAQVAYSDVEGGFAGEGNINLPPLFADTSYYLQSGSPCIDVGDTSSTFNDPPDPNNAGFALWPAEGTLRNDMGAYGGPWSSIIANVVTTEVSSDAQEIPRRITLFQNYPNPFNPVTTIHYELSSPMDVSLRIFDLLGREVASLLNGNQQAGEHTVQWNAGEKASGIYVYRLTAGPFNETRTLILLK